MEMKVGKPLNKLIVTQPFGDTDFAKAHRSWYKVYGGIHGGVDYRGKSSDFTYAIWEGTITCKVTKGFGKHIYLTSLDGRYKAIYAHLNLFIVKTGDKVLRGATLGKVGSSGNVTGPHLHLEGRDLSKGSTIKEQIFDLAPAIARGYMDDDIMISKNELIKALGKFVGVDYKESDPNFQAHLRNPNISRMLEGFFAAHRNITTKEIIDLINGS